MSDPGMRIPFNRPHMTGRELDYIRQAHDGGQLSGDGPFTEKCQAWLEQRLGCARALLTHSGTAALEMAAMLAGIGFGDEVIMPSFTFVSTANAVVLRGGVPVFVDIRPDTLNMDESAVEAAITAPTKAIMPVHYAGVACDMDAIAEVARRHRLAVIEDAAHGLMASYRGREAAAAGRPLGSLGQMAAFSFHETKNLTSGEGGALIVNDPELVERAEVIWEKGTNRRRFHRGEVEKYTWVDVGSSYLPSELAAAFLWAQMEEAEAITARRRAIWDRYHEAFAELEADGLVRRPVVPAACGHNAHMYYLLLPDEARRDAFIERMRQAGIMAVFHFVPLDSSAAGRRYGRPSGRLDVTREMSGRVVRLPLWVGLEGEQDYVIEQAIEAVRERA